MLQSASNISRWTHFSVFNFLRIKSGDSPGEFQNLCEKKRPTARIPGIFHRKTNCRVGVSGAINIFRLLHFIRQLISHINLLCAALGTYCSCGDGGKRLKKENYSARESGIFFFFAFWLIFRFLISGAIKTFQNTTRERKVAAQCVGLVLIKKDLREEHKAFACHELWARIWWKRNKKVFSAHKNQAHRAHDYQSRSNGSGWSNRNRYHAASEMQFHGGSLRRVP